MVGIRIRQTGSLIQDEGYGRCPGERRTSQEQNSGDRRSGKKEETCESIHKNKQQSLRL